MMLRLTTMAGNPLWVRTDKIDAIEKAHAPGETDIGCRVAINGLWVWVAMTAAEVLASLDEELTDG